MEGFENENNHTKESDLKLVDFPFICRICLKQSDMQLCKVEDYLLDLFLTITKIDVRSTESYPRNICTVCINTLKFISLFIDMSKYIDARSAKNEHVKTVKYGTSLNHVVKIEETTVEYKEEVQYIKGFEICQICSSTSKLTLFEEKPHLMQLFQNITNIAVKADNFCRNAICSKCISKLEHISLFISLSLRNNTKLENTIIKNKAIETENSIAISFSKCDDVKFENILDENQVKLEDGLDDDARVYESNLKTYIDIKEEIVDNAETSIEPTYRNELRIVEKPFKCVNQNDNLQTHLLTHTEKIPFKCDYCEKTFNNKNSSKRHILTHTRKKRIKCDSCEKSFNNEISLQRHVLNHTGKKRFKCDYCEKSFIKKSHFRTHLLIHTKEKHIKCENSSNHKINLRRQCETGEKPFLCDTCGKCFSKKPTLLHHMLTHTGQKPFKCDICEKSFNLKANLKRHLLTHTEESFHQDGDLRRLFHLLTDSKKYSFQCDICDKSFTQKHTLQSHMLSHTGEKSFKCDLCEKSFSHRHNLRRHLRTHTGERPFKCDSCENSFRERSDLQRHVLTHTGEKPFKCHSCDKSFNHKGNLRKHMLTHAEEKSFECE